MAYDNEDADGDFFPDSWDVSITLAGVVNNHPDHTENSQVSPTPRVPAVADADGNYVNNPDDDPNGIGMSGNLPMNGSTGVHTLHHVVARRPTRRVPHPQRPLHLS